MPKFRIAARQSDLARLQAETVGQALKNQFPDLDIEYYYRASLGDQQADRPLWESQSKGVFTQDFYQDLIDGAVEAVVHSWKDLPVEQRPGTQIGATLPRADLRDVLLMAKTTQRHKPSLIKVLSSSPRRIYATQRFLKKALPWSVTDVEFAPVRGNVATRIQKLLKGDGDVLFVAKAALDRLLRPGVPGFESASRLIRDLVVQCNFQVWPISECPPAPAQGALAIEVASNRSDVLDMLKKIDDPLTFESVQKERQILSAYGGGCHQKIGVACLHKPWGQLTVIRGEAPDGVKLHEDRLLTDAGQPSLPKPKRLHIFPSDTRAEALFDREPLELSKVREQLNQKRNWWVARDIALPRGFCPDEVDYLWTAGVRTWQSLAERGFWVHGTADSLGELEDPQIDVLAGKPIDWVKVSHVDSAALNLSRYPIVGTYRLVPKSTRPDFAQKTHFFWMSGSQFLRALELDPTLAERGLHSSGPGLTADTVKTHLRGQARYRTELSYEHWLKSLL